MRYTERLDYVHHSCRAHKRICETPLASRYRQKVVAFNVEAKL